jgi:hypothetical protein
MSMTLRFKIGDAFPAGDPVARFITVLAMMSNDWMRSARYLLEIQDGSHDEGGRRLMLFRQQASLHHEAASFIVDARHRFPAIDAFLDGLPEIARVELAQIAGGVDPKSPHYHGDWLANHRNVTFHYPEMHPDKAAHGAEEVYVALTTAAGIESTITVGDDFGSVRFGFADDVVVQWLPDVETEARDILSELREAVLALARFVQRASRAYLEGRPQGTFTVEGDDDE